jgi:hypothetical protein
MPVIALATDTASSASSRSGVEQLLRLQDRGARDLHFA